MPLVSFLTYLSSSADSSSSIHTPCTSLSTSALELSPWPLLFLLTITPFPVITSVVEYWNTPQTWCQPSHLLKTPDLFSVPIASPSSLPEWPTGISSLTKLWIFPLIPACLQPSPLEGLSFQLFRPRMADLDFLIFRQTLMYLPSNHGLPFLLLPLWSKPLNTDQLNFCSSFLTITSTPALAPFINEGDSSKTNQIKSLLC